MITHVKGDLFAANERAIAHGCNCHGVMGAGVARIVANKFPEAFDAYRLAYRSGQFYPGVAQPVVCHEEPLDSRIGEATMVYNLATQNAPGANARLDYVDAAFRNMKRHMDHVGNKRIAMPKIGAGIGGLNWEDVEACLVSAFLLHDTSYDIVVYSL